MSEELPQQSQSESQRDSTNAVRPDVCKGCDLDPDSCAGECTPKGPVGSSQEGCVEKLSMPNGDVTLSEDQQAELARNKALAEQVINGFAGHMMADHDLRIGLIVHGGQAGQKGLETLELVKYEIERAFHAGTALSINHKMFVQPCLIRVSSIPEEEGRTMDEFALTFVELGPMPARKE